MSLIKDINEVLSDVLQIDASSFDENTALLGELPEFDSMAVVQVIVTLGDKYGIEVADDELDAETFESVGALAAFIQNKLDAK